MIYHHDQLANLEEEFRLDEDPEITEIDGEHRKPLCMPVIKIHSHGCQLKQQENLLFGIILLSLIHYMLSLIHI